MYPEERRNPSVTLGGMWKNIQMNYFVSWLVSCTVIPKMHFVQIRLTRNPIFPFLVIPLLQNYLTIFSAFNEFLAAG
jgi:hypothetical protein